MSRVFLTIPPAETLMTRWRALALLTLLGLGDTNPWRVSFVHNLAGKLARAYVNPMDGRSHAYFVYYDGHAFLVGSSDNSSLAPDQVRIHRKARALIAQLCPHAADMLPPSTGWTFATHARPHAEPWGDMTGLDQLLEEPTQIKDAGILFGGLDTVQAWVENDLERPDLCPIVPHVLLLLPMSIEECRRHAGLEVDPDALLDAIKQIGYPLE